MARVPRIDVGGEIYHCLNRSVGRQTIFHEVGDYRLFESILQEVKDVTNIDILAYSLMPNHWHLVLRPRSDGDLSDFMKRITVTHTQRYRVKTRTVGEGTVYQGRYKSFLIQEDKHLMTVLRYVERNPLTANIVSDVCDWEFGSVYKRYKGTQKQKQSLATWPIVEPSDYLDIINNPLTAKEYEKISLSKKKGVPYGSDEFVMDRVEKYNLQSTLRGKGRPKKV